MSVPWAAPDAAPQPSPVTVPPQDGGPAAVHRPRRTEAPLLPPLPVPMRPMTIPDLLDGGFAILKLRPRDVLTLAVVFIVPINVVSALLLRDVLDQGAFDTTADPGAFSAVGAGFVSFAIDAASLALLAGALAHLVGRWYAGEHVSAGASILVALRRSPALLVAVVLVHLLEAVGVIALVVGAYAAMALLHVVAPVVVAEGVGPFRAIGRSMRLTAARFGASLAVPGLVALIGAVIGFGFGLIPEAVTGVVPDDWDWLVRAVGQTLAALVVTPFTAGVAVLYHLDLRMRVEGHDIEQRIRAVFPR